jgi:hypothetical protein
MCVCLSVYLKHTLNAVPVKNEVLLRDKEERNILYAIKRRKAKWFGHNLRRNRLLKHVIEGNIERRERRGRRCKQLLDDHLLLLLLFLLLFLLLILRWTFASFMDFSQSALFLTSLSSFQFCIC